MMLSKNKKYYPWVILISCFHIISCASKTQIPIEEPPKKSIRVQLSKETRDSILLSDRVVYYELPETSITQNPEDYLTFSQPVKNSTYIDRFKTLVTSKEQTYLEKPPNNCLPTYNSALVFTISEKKNIILFSINCAVLFLYNDKLFVDISENLNQLEDNFRMIRSGR
jgi:hypothetical protein